MADLQRLTGAAIMRPLAADATMQKRWVDGSSMHDFASKLIKPNSRCSSFERLEIYNRQYWFRLLDCLVDDYPGVRSIIGQEKFEKLSEAYLQKHPSRSYSIRDLGSHLADFIARHPKLIGPQQKVAYDMARLEWARVIAFDGPTLPSASGVEIARAGAAKLKLALQPHISLLELDYPVDELSLAQKRAEILRTEAGTTNRAKNKKYKAITNPRKQRRYVVVHRIDNAVYFKSLEPAQFYILWAINCGKSIEQACAFALRKVTARERHALTPQSLQLWFGHWASFGWFCQSKSH